MRHNKINIHYILYPLSILYGLGVHFRNQLFDWGHLPTRSFPIPVICVGNLAVGGTGKTPHIEYLVRLLAPQYRVAVLSRGYKRQSKGFQLADRDSTPQQLGDEPYQLWAKFHGIQVAVDTDRCHGIDQLLQLPSPPEVVLLDDAYQHRYVHAGLTLLLTDYSRPFYADTLLPAGRLREKSQGKKRADIIIVTKSPLDLSSEKIQEIQQQIHPDKKQSVFFSRLSYQQLQPVFPIDQTTSPVENCRPSSESDILLVTGIAQPAPVEDYVRTHYQRCQSLTYPDHHAFTEKDIHVIAEKFHAIANKEKAILVTEKDAVRLRHNPFIPESLKTRIYFLPLEIVFLQNENNKFNQIILDYVAENQRNS